MNEKTQIAYSEVYEILSYMDKEQVMKIPVEILQGFKDNKKINFNSKIDKKDIFNKENISRKALSILGYLNLTYWVNEEKKRELSNLYRKNDFLKSENKKEVFEDNLFINKNNELICKYHSREHKTHYRNVD